MTGSANAPSRWGRWLAGATIGLAWLAAFAPALVAGRVFGFRDLFFFHRPLHEAMVRVTASGALPFLNPELNLGQPMLADPSYAVYYPANLLFLVLPFTTAWNLVLSGHVLWACLGAYRLARALGADRPGALAGGLAFGLGGPIVSSLNAYGLLLAASWIPWVFQLALGAWRLGGVRTPIAAAALAAQALTGEPTILAVTSLVVTIGWIVGVATSPGRRRSVGRGAALGVLALALAAPQIVPTLAWLPHTDRGEGLPFRESAAWWSFHPERIAELAYPGIEGDPMGPTAAAFWGAHLSDAGFPYLPCVYLGWLPLVAAPLAWRHRWGRAALVLAVAGVALSLGHHLPGYEALYRAVPVLWVTRYPEKFLLFAALGLTVAFALGVGEAARGGRVAALAAFAGWIVLGLALALGTWGVPSRGLTLTQESLRTAALLRGGIAGIAAVVLVIAASRPGRIRTVCSWLIAMVAALDIALVTPNVAATRGPTDDRQMPAALEAVPALVDEPILHLGEVDPDPYFTAGDDPYASMQAALQPLSGLRWGVAYGATGDISRTMWAPAARRLGAIVASLPDAAAIASMRAMGIARVIALAPVEGAGLELESVVRGAGRPAVFVYRVEPPPAPFVRDETTGRGLRWHGNVPYRLTIDCDTSAPAGVVIARNALPGWTARADGRPLAIGATVDGLLRVEPPTGTTTIELAYEPPGLRLGVGLGIAGLLGALVVAGRDRTARWPRRRCGP